MPTVSHTRAPWHCTIPTCQINQFAQLKAEFYFYSHNESHSANEFPVHKPCTKPSRPVFFSEFDNPRMTGYGLMRVYDEELASHSCIVRYDHVLSEKDQNVMSATPKRRAFIDLAASLQETRQNATEIRRCACLRLLWPCVAWPWRWPLTFWSQSLMNSSVHQSCRFGEIPPRGLWNIVFAWRTDNWKYNASMPSTTHGGRRYEKDPS